MQKEKKKINNLKKIIFLVIEIKIREGKSMVILPKKKVKTRLKMITKKVEMKMKTKMKIKKKIVLKTKMRML